MCFFLKLPAWGWFFDNCITDICVSRPLGGRDTMIANTAGLQTWYLYSTYSTHLLGSFRCVEYLPWWTLLNGFKRRCQTQCLSSHWSVSKSCPAGPMVSQHDSKNREQHLKSSLHLGWLVMSTLGWSMMITIWGAYFPDGWLNHQVSVWPPNIGWV
jgi:hypothetical protein